MFKNVATKIALFAFDTTTGAAKTGDAANVSAYVSKDYGSVTQLTDTSATEMDATNAKGWYLFDVAQAESNADALLFTGKSSTANVSVVGQYIFTTPNRFTTMVIDAAGLVDGTAVKVGPSGAATAQTAGDIPARLPAALVSGRMDSSVGAMAADTLTSSALASSAVTEIQTGLSTLDAAGVRAAVGLASANLDTQLSTIAGYIDTEVGAIKTKTDQLTFTVANQVDVNVVDWKGSTAPAMTGDAFARLGAPAGASVSADVAAVKAVDDAVKAKTDNLPSDPADASDIASAFSTVNANLATVAGYVDTEVASIKAVTDKLDNTLENSSDGYIFTVNSLQNAPTSGGSLTAADVWAYATRTLTAIDEDSTTLDLDATIRAAVGLASANLDTQFSGIAASVWDEIIEGAFDARESMRVQNSFAAGKSNGFDTLTPAFRDLSDTKVVIDGEVDEFGNRVSVTLDVT